ncbi:unnamed protein product [Rotaria sp. Silwood2]|nr:unnamed protein product [Rotaria sp. Silwood2]
MKPIRDIPITAIQTNTNDDNMKQDGKQNNNLFMEIMQQQQELNNKLPPGQMKFIIEDRVFKAIPNLRVAIIVAKDIKYNENAILKIKKILQTYWKEGAHACQVYPNVQSHPQIKAWRDCFTSLGIPVKKYSSSVESLLKRAVKQSEPRSINPLVDLYSAMCTHYILPFGAFDIDDLSKDIPLELRFTKSSDTFMALDENESKPVSENEIAYLIGSQILTRAVDLACCLAGAWQAAGQASRPGRILKFWPGLIRLKNFWPGLQAGQAKLSCLGHFFFIYYFFSSHIENGDGATN